MRAFLAEGWQADGIGSSRADADFQRFVARKVVDETFAGGGGFAFIDVFRAIETRHLMA